MQSDESSKTKSSDSQAVAKRSAEPAKECRHGVLRFCPFCAMNKLEERIAELEYLLAQREETIDELKGTIDGLVERCALINA